MTRQSQRNALCERSRAVLSEAPKEKARYEFHSGLFMYVGAGEMNRTPDLLITNELLYRLSYTGNASDYTVLW